MKVSLLKAIDKYVGVPTCLILGGFYSAFFYTPQFWQEPKRIAIIKLWAIGDSVVLLPTIKALKKAFPSTKIDVIARERNEAVFESCSDVDKIILFEPKNIFKILNLHNYDLVIDAEPWMNTSALLSFYIGKRRIGFGGKVRSLMYSDTIDLDKNKHMVRNYLQMVSVMNVPQTKDSLVRLKTRKDDKEIVNSFMRLFNLKGKLLIGICAGGADSAPSRMWPAKRFAELANKLIERFNATVVLFGAADEEEYLMSLRDMMKHPSAVVITAGWLNLKQTFEAISRCKLFISNDTGPMHIAAAQGVKTIGLFGSSSPELWAPYGKNCRYIYHQTKCSPCNKSWEGLTPDCKLKVNKNKCMRAITVNEVFNKAKELLRRN